MTVCSAIWVLAGGPMQIPLIRELKQAGFAVIVSDGSSACPAAELADVFMELDTFDVPGHLDAAQEIIRTLKIQAVLTVAADCHETVSALAEHLGLPGVPRAISRSLRRKDHFRQIMKDAGVLQPEFFLVDSLGDAQERARQLDCDIVLKATDNSGSRGMTFLQRGQEITHQDFDRALKAGTSGVVLVEEALRPNHTPSELSVETLWVEGEMVLLNCVHRLFRDDLEKLGLSSAGLSGRRWGVEIGHINPAELDEHQIEAVRETMLSVGKTFGFDSLESPAVLKGDLMHSTKGLAVLEATPRLSGGWDSSGTTLARGANFQVGFTRLLLGANPRTVFEEDFSFSHPDLFSAAMTLSPADALDSMGRLFGLGTGKTAMEAIQDAISNIREEEQWQTGSTKKG